ncbi:hypothetical protein JCM8097_005658 [Rhodosporidiobolus ruineniae]
MDWLADRVDSLAKQASELTVYDLKSAVNKAKAYALNLTEYEQKVRDATNDEPWGASSTLMQDIAQGQLFNEIMPTIYSRFTEKEARQWRQIYKSLVLLEYLIKNGSERVIDDARSHLSLIRVLRNFHYTDENGKDQGINVRNRAKEVGELLSDLDRVRMERRKAKANRNKYTGVGNDGLGGGGPSFTSASGSRYGGFGSDSFNGGSDSYSGGGGGGGGGFSGGFQESRGNADEFEEYDAGDDDDRRDRRGGASSSASASASRSSSTRVSSASKPTPAPPKPAPQPEVNLFDFDDEEQQPVPPPKPAAAAPAAASLDDDFDDFQSAAPAPSALPVPSISPGPVPAAAAPTGAHRNVFDLLNPQAGSRPPAQLAPSPAYAPQQSTGFSTPLASQPLQARPAMQPQTSSFASPAPAASAAPAAKKPAAADFSDLFDAFGSSSSSASASKPAGGAAGGQSLAQIAAQKRQDQLFSMGGGAAKPAAGGSSGGGDGWDSLL